MAKPVITFSAVPYKLNGKLGYRPQLEAQNGVYDLDFCKEVVTEKRLAMSADELLHALEMVGEVGPAKVALDGRPRGFTKLLKWNRFGNGKLESPSSPWNASCKAMIRAQLLADATKEIDAIFRNETEGIGVRLNDVTYIGAKTVQNVIKVGVHFAAYGSHMEFIEGDTAILKVGAIEHPLTCVASDVSSAEFEFPEALEDVEPGTQALFLMKSRGGVEDGQVYTVKKLVTILASDDPRVPKIKKVVNKDGLENTWHDFADDLTITAKYAADADATIAIELYKKATGAKTAEVVYTDGNALTRVDDETFKVHLCANTTAMPDGAWENTADNEARLYLRTSLGETYIVLNLAK